MRTKLSWLVVIYSCFALFLPCPTRPRPVENCTDAAIKAIRRYDPRFCPGIPHWPGFGNEERVTTYYYDEGIGTKGHGFLAHEYMIPGQWGTHVDPPAHFPRGNAFWMTSR